MTIALPPPQTPTMGNLEHLRAAAAHGFTFDFVQYHVHVSGNDKLSNAEIEQAFVQAPTLSAGVRRIAGLYYRAGYPVTRVLYALSGLDLYVQIVVKGVDRVESASPLDSYFKALAGKKPLTDTQLQRRRLLANVAADRAGVNSNLSVANTGSDEHPDYVLKAPVEGDPGWAVHGLLDYGNIGNRYVGKDIVDGGMTVTAPFGGQLNLTAISNTPGSVSGSLYREFAGSYSQVTPYGIFGVDGRYVMLHREFAGLHLREKIRQAGISWLFPIYVDFERQITFRAHATRNSLATRLTELPGIDAKSELYTALSFAFNYGQYLGAERHWQILSGLGIEHGFGPHHTKLTYAQLDYWLFRPTFTLKYAADAPWRVTLAMRGQLTSDTLPETKEWVLGGLSQLSAYHAGVLVGDVGGVGSLTLAYANQPLWFATLTPAVFVEYGYSSQRHAIGNSPRLHGQQLADAGGSLQIALGDHLAARASIADGFYDHNLNPSVRHAHRAIYMFRVSASF